jgi:hypothetical protein
MIVKITNMYSAGRGLQVSFQSLVGNGLAEWVGEPPKIGQEYDIEMTLNETFCWGENIKPSANSIDLFYTVKSKAHILAELISIDDDKCAAIRLNGFIILIELDRVPEEKPNHIYLTATQILFHPANL